ncbi:helix-turn-helix domain-containing protein [Aequorivita sp. SDUM287046]|uniref:Helix-turn-helix domain-containing protein n=1 Tax=Aequorivita aurantiaca TaxID=3053356 RepID=A0ABT8DMP7_9FLAO|nr:helix-turn-helix domain-containing protein [Aequorivita aurantiaca]MDN3725284.1 helix-turn-helix domain-containing protein [Aequorivita aurantiaca]
MKALTNKVKAKKEVGSNTEQMPSALNKRPEPFLKLLEGENEILTEADMMRIFHVDHATIYRWRQKAILPAIKINRNVYYIKQIIITILLAKSGYLNPQ